jgi:ubiquinone/menaquinone biosynthesis C-methylase UbiE
MGQRTFDDFDDFANDYRKIHADNIKISGVDSFYFAEMKVRLLGEFEIDESLATLDVGCGDGATELFMQQYFPAWKVKGIDISQKSIAEANKRGLPNATFISYDGLEIPLQDGSIDIVFIAGVLHHVNYSLHPVILKEIYRVLKNGGRLYIFEHNPLNPLTRHLVNTCIFDKDAKLLRSTYTTRLIEKSCFKIEERQFIIFFPRKGIFSGLIFLEKYLKWLPLGGQYFIRAAK